MDQKAIIRLWLESGSSSASKNYLTTFCRPFVHYWYLRLYSAIVHFIRNNCLYFVCYGWSAQALTALAALPIYLAWYNCTSSKTAVFNTDIFRHLIMSQQGKRKTMFAGLLYITKNWNFPCVLYAHSQFLRSLARFDLANRGVRQPVQPHIFHARLLLFDKTSAQHHFAVVNCSDAVMRVFTPLF